MTFRYSREGSKTKRVSTCFLCTYVLVIPVLLRKTSWLTSSFGALFPSANFTRFYIIARSIDWQLPSLPTHCDPWSYSYARNKGLLRIREQKSHDPSPGFAQPVNLADLLSAMDLQICRIDRRPLLGAKTFAHVYIVEVNDTIRPPSSANSSPIIPDSTAAMEDLRGCGDVTDLQSNKPFALSDGDDGPWPLRLREAAGRVTEAGGDGEVLGCWS